MNNEYESGLYGTNIKYFETTEDFNDYIEDESFDPVEPNVAYIENDGETDNIVVYNWNLSSGPVVLTEDTNPYVYNLLVDNDIDPDQPNGFTAAGLAAIPLNKLYFNPTPEEWNKIGTTPNSVSIFTGYDIEDIGDYTWMFNEFQYFTQFTNIPVSMFDSCMNLTEITLPPTITAIHEDAFHDCWDLVNIDMNGLNMNNISFDDESFRYCGRNAYSIESFFDNEYNDESNGFEDSTVLIELDDEGLFINYTT